jgi:hypothetical protein
VNEITIQATSTLQDVRKAVAVLDMGWLHPAWDYPADKVEALLRSVNAHPSILESTCHGCEDIQNAVHAFAITVLEWERK